MADFIEGEVRALGKRMIDEVTCQKFGYTVGTFKDKKVQLAPYYDDEGNLVAQKVRFPDKTFTFTGKMKQGQLFGQHLWPTEGKRVIITEGEIDALSVSQLQGNKWPVVSVPNGAQGAKKSLEKQLKWLQGFEEVVLMFDMDDEGRKATAECAPLFKPGTCKVAVLPLKDANEMLQAGRGDEVIKAIWNAKVYRPDGIVTLKDIRAKILQPIEDGLPWAYETLTKYTYGRRPGEIYAIGAGTGIGKTDFLTQQIEYDLSTLKEKVGVFFLEQQPDETGKRIAGKHAGKLFHIPGDWTTEELDKALDELGADNSIFFYDHFGSTDWDIIENTIRYLAHSEGVRIFYLDHLTALAAGQEDERKALEDIMARMGSLVKELNIILVIVSHLSTPDGKPHEEGGRVMIRHFKGSRAIGFWCHYMFGLERDQQSDDEAEAKTTTFRCLKDRYTGQATGKVFYLGYDQSTGRLFETENPEFQDETKKEGEDAF